MSSSGRVDRQLAGAQDLIGDSQRPGAAKGWAESGVDISSGMCLGLVPPFLSCWP